MHALCVCVCVCVCVCECVGAPVGSGGVGLIGALAEAVAHWWSPQL